MNVTEARILELQGRLDSSLHDCIRFRRRYTIAMIGWCISLLGIVLAINAPHS
jgi:hypothetical protein